MRVAPLVLAGLVAVPAWRPVRRFLTAIFPTRVDEPCELGADVVGGRVEPGAQAIVVPVRKKAWEASLGGEDAARPFVAARLAGWPSRLTVDAAELPSDDRELVRRLASDTWRGLDAFTDREHHLPVDHVHLGTGPAGRAGARVGDYVNLTTIGLDLLAIVAAHDLGLVPRDGALARARGVLTTLAALETHDGFFFNYYDTTSLERTSNLVSFVDSTWLAAALIVLRNAFPETWSDCSAILARQNYGYFYDPTLGRMSHGYWVHLGARSRYHYGVLYAESRLGSVIAIGKGDVPEDHWFRMTRTFSPACTWQTQEPHERRLKTVRGHSFFGGWYEWRGERYVPSWGGSMFEALMPTLVLDEQRLAPTSLGANDAAHVTVQQRFAREELGWPVWGLSPSSTPTGQSYGEYGARPLGALGYPAGAVTPHAALLALPVAPEAALADLRALVTRFDVYGDYGLYDAVDPVSGGVARTYLALDQAMILVAAANWVADGAVQRRFAADPIVARALPVLAAERFFD